jgi:hypothetical protein
MIVRRKTLRQCRNDNLSTLERERLLARLAAKIDPEWTPTSTSTPTSMPKPRKKPRKRAELELELYLVAHSSDKQAKQYHTGSTKNLTMRQVRNNNRKKILVNSPKVRRAYRKVMLKASIELFEANGIQHYAEFCIRALASETRFQWDDILKAECMARGEEPQAYTIAAKKLGLSLSELHSQFLVDAGLDPEAPVTKRRN